MPQAYHDPTYLREIWGLGSVGALVLLTRILVRLRTVGLRHLAGDDYATMAVALFCTGEAVSVTVTYKLGENLDFTQKQLAQMTPRQLDQVDVGSRMELFCWYCYICLLWSLKTCMLFFYYRLTSGLPLQKYVIWIAWVTGVSYLVVFLTVSCGCFPIQRNWQVIPDPGWECTFRPQNFYCTTIMNVLTDAALLCVPMPLLWRLRVSWKKKLGLGLLLFPGIFVIAAALTRCVMSLSVNPNALNINRWGGRETVAGIVAVNSPILKPMFLKSFWRPESSTQNSSESSSHGRKRSKSKAAEQLPTYEMDGGSQTPKHLKSGWATATAVLKGLDSRRGSSDHVRGDASSEEYIISKDDRERDVDVEKGPEGGEVSTTLESDDQMRESRSLHSSSGDADPWDLGSRERDGHGSPVMMSVWK